MTEFHEYSIIKIQIFTSKSVVNKTLHASFCFLSVTCLIFVYFPLVLFYISLINLIIKIEKKKYLFGEISLLNNIIKKGNLMNRNSGFYLIFSRTLVG